MSFTELLADLGALTKTDADLTKSIGDNAGDDAAIAAAAAEGAAAGEDEDVDAAAAAAAAAEPGKGEDETVMKSMTITNEAGETEDVIDATDFLKSLSDRVEANEVGATAAIGQLVDLVKSQSGQISALSGQIKTLAAAGRGRRGVVSVAERPALNKSLGAEPDKPEGLNANEFMAKALTAMREGKINGGELSACESRLNRGVQPDPAIVSKVLG